MNTSMGEAFNAVGADATSVTAIPVNLGSLADWAVVIVAALALWVAYRQLKLVVAAEDRSAVAIESQAKVARATLMLEIDQFLRAKLSNGRVV